MSVAKLLIKAVFSETRQSLGDFLRKYSHAALIGFTSAVLATAVLIVGNAFSLFYSIPYFIHYIPLVIALVGVVLTVVVFLNVYLGGPGTTGREAEKELFDVSEADEDSQAQFDGKSSSGVLISDSAGNTFRLPGAVSDTSGAVDPPSGSGMSSSQGAGLQLPLRLLAAWQTTDRLLSEIDELRKRAKVNLTIGSATAAAGIGVFTFFLLSGSSSSSFDLYLAREFAPRISLLIVIEIFAYFFLRLYKNDLSEIKFYHNEITNLDLRFVALREARSLSDGVTAQEVVRELAGTERNSSLTDLKGDSLDRVLAALEAHQKLIGEALGKLPLGKK